MSSLGLFHIPDDVQDEESFFKNKPIDIFRFNKKSKKLIQLLFKCIQTSSSNSIYHEEEEKKTTIKTLYNYMEFINNYNEQDNNDLNQEEEGKEEIEFLKNISECKWVEELKNFVPKDNEGYEEYIDEKNLTKGLKNIAIDFISRTKKIQDRVNYKIIQKICYADEKMGIKRDKFKETIKKCLEPHYELSTPPQPASVLLRSQTVNIDIIKKEKNSNNVFELSLDCHQYIVDTCPILFVSNDKAIKSEISSLIEKDRHCNLKDLWFFDFNGDDIVTRDDLIEGFINYGHHFISTDNSCQNLINSYIQKKIIHAINLIYDEELTKNKSTSDATTNLSSSNNNVVYNFLDDYKVNSAIFYYDIIGNEHICIVLEIPRLVCETYICRIDCKSVILDVDINTLSLNSRKINVNYHATSMVFENISIKNQLQREISDDPLVIAELEQVILSELYTSSEFYNPFRPNICNQSIYLLKFGDMLLHFNEQNYGTSFEPFFSHIDDSLVECCPSALESLRCSFIHLGIALEIHPFILQFKMRSLAKEINNDSNNTMKAYFEAPLSDLLTPHRMVDMNILPLIWLNEEFKGARIMVLSFKTGYDDDLYSFNSNAIYTPKEYSGKDIILKLQNSHFSLLEPDSNLSFWSEHPIDDIVSVITSFEIDFPEEKIHCDEYLCPQDPSLFL
jgi:hypothetical protein